MRALDDAVVLEIGDVTGVEYAGKLLADLGARVVKIEPPDGARSRHQPPFQGDASDPDSSIHFWYYNTSKESVVCDVTTAQGRERLQALLPGATVVLDGGDAPLPAMLGLAGTGAEALGQGIVYCRITPFGDDGPWAGYRSSDLVQLAVGGIMASCGYDDPTAHPVAPSGSQSHHMTGVNIAMGVLVALLGRSRTGAAAPLDVSAHDCVALSTEMAFTYWEYQRTTPRRQTGRHARPYDTSAWNHLCRDGRYVSCLPLYLTDDRFAAMVDWFDEHGCAGNLRDPRYATRDQRTALLDEIIPVIAEFCARQDSDYVFHEGQARRLPWAPVGATWDLLADPHFIDREAFVMVARPEPDATFSYPGAPYKLSRTPWSLTGHAPSLPHPEAPAHPAALVAKGGNA